MGARGPAKAPAKLRLLNGRADGRDSGGRTVDLPPPADELDPDTEPPAWLTPYAVEVWRASLPWLVRLKLTKPEDMSTLAAYCLAVDQVRVTTIDLTERGYVHEVTKPGVRWVPRDDPAWNEDDARGQAADDDPGEGALGYFAPWPVIERKANPSAALRNAAMSQIKALGGQFGFSPSAMNSLAGLGKSGGGTGGNAGANPFDYTG